MGDKGKDLVLQNLASLGCGFYTDPPEHVADPERVIVDSLQSFWTDQKLFTMLLATLTHRIHDLIHVERLLSLAESLSQDEKIILMVIADKMVDLGDRRFSLIVSKLKKRGQKVSSIPEIHSRPYFHKKWGLDPNFQKFKMKVPNYFEQPTKKLYTLKGILAGNPWLKMRALIGSNYRADLVYLKASRQIENPKDAIEALSCSTATIYRLWSSISLVDDLEDLTA